MVMDGSTDALMSAAGGVKGASNAAVVSNLMINLVLSGAMNLLWGLINSLQLIVVMPLFQVFIPSNASFLLSVIMDIANLNVLLTDDIYGEMFNFTQTEPYRENFGFAGYETSNYILNLGTMFLIILVFMVIICFTFLLSCHLARSSEASYLSSIFASKALLFGMVY